MEKTMPLNGSGCNATHHRVIDYEKLMRIGIKGILEKLTGI